MTWTPEKFRGVVEHMIRRNGGNLWTDQIFALARHFELPTLSAVLPPDLNNYWKALLAPHVQHIAGLPPEFQHAYEMLLEARRKKQERLKQKAVSVWNNKFTIVSRHGRIARRTTWFIVYSWKWNTFDQRPIFSRRVDFHSGGAMVFGRTKASHERLSRIIQKSPLRELHPEQKPVGIPPWNNSPVHPLVNLPITYSVDRVWERIGEKYSQHLWFARRKMHREKHIALSAPDPSAPDHLGWRCWIWDHDGEVLQSPVMKHLWESEELRRLSCFQWDDSNEVGAHPGIHARRLPKHDWRTISPFAWCALLDENLRDVTIIHGIVERFGRAVIGTLGWRAEHVVIRELLAPNTKIGLALERRYPHAVIHYRDSERVTTDGNRKSACDSSSSAEIYAAPRTEKI